MSAPPRVRIGTRASALALFQAEQVAAALQARGVATELVTYTTVGDRRLDVPLHGIGAKGLFTEELEADLLAGRVDCCVHSLKDLPTASPAGLAIVAQLEREDPRDALVLAPSLAHLAPRLRHEGVDALPARALVGTSSLRRRAQLLERRPDVQVAELRGNVPTRLRKVDEEQVQAAVLAAAGLHRLGLGERVAAYLEPPHWLPAAGQGAIAVQARADDLGMRRLLAPLDHAATTHATAAERAFLGALEGGCQVPIAALAVAGPRPGALALHGLIAALDGRTVVRGVAELPGMDAAGVAGSAGIADATAAGRRLAEELRARGGDAVLDALRNAGAQPAPQPE